MGKNLNRELLSNLYDELLLRPIDRVGMDYFFPLLENKKINLSQVREIIINSDEFKNRQGNNPKVIEFSKLYFQYKNRLPIWGDTHWFGVQTLKVPLDLWIYQEIIFQIKPDYIIETGTWRGGSALFLAHICDTLNHGQVITIDVESRDPPKHKRISYFNGSSTDPSIINKIKKKVNSKNKILVILDSLHDKKHVLQEMELYKEFVSENSYLIVEDTLDDHYPLFPDIVPGPMAAVVEFLKNNNNFKVDTKCEKFLLTSNFNGYLKRIK